jgi:MFS family permease
VASGGQQVTRTFAAGSPEAERVVQPRDDLVGERPVSTPDGALAFEQDTGPFTSYRRTVVVGTDGVTETTDYRLAVPWFGWLFRLPVRSVISRRTSSSAWWTPPDRLDPSQVLVVGLLAAASMTAAFVNTLFTQTANFAADDFGVGDTGIGVAGAVVRVGIVLALPAAFLADRVGRRKVIIVVAWLAPLFSVLGALAPTFPVLVLTQTIARPMGVALAFLIGVVAAEEMPRNSRAYAISILAMASGLGAGVAVVALGLADLGESAWRLVYLVSAVWCLVAVDLARRLPETRRFIRQHVTAPHLDRRRLLLLAVVAFAGNIFVASASFFQNRYLNDVRGFSALEIGVFSLVVGTPAALGLIVGGRIADTSGRRRLIAIAVPLSTVAIVGAFAFGGAALWVLSFLGGLIGSAAYPALAVYRAELFPTGNRSKAAGMVTATALIGGVIGLIATGSLIDRGWSFGSVMAMLALSQVVVVVLVVVAYPETAHLELEEINPEDELFVTPGSSRPE